jgi:hypothetical protein
MNYMNPTLPLDPFAWPGGYPVLWIADIDTHNCTTLCAKCATEERANETISTLIPSIHWEGPPEICEGCNEEIPSAYGDPAEES